MKKTIKINTPKEEAPVTADINFTYDGKKYKVTKGAVVQDATGTSQKLTAADIGADAAVQKYLVENKCSCIEEVTE